MKSTKPRVKFSFNTNWRKLGLLLLSSIFSAIIFSLVLIAIPQTEKLLKTVRYDIVQAPAQWQQSYILQLTINSQDQSNSANLIAQTESIIYNRLKSYGVETVTFQQTKQDKTHPEVTVTVVSSKDQADIEQLVGQRYFLQFVIRKPGVKFDDTSNPLVNYDISNYTLTEFTRYYFRTVYVTKLRSTSGTDAYFAIYKPWPNSSDKFFSYFDPYVGQEEGISIDGFVNPIMIPTTQIQNSNGNLQRQPFAIALSTDAKAANVQNILLNSGVIPIEYNLSKTNTLKLDGNDNNYLHFVEISAAVVILSLVLGLIFKKKEFDTVKFLFISAIPIFTLITIAKVISYAVLPYDLFIAYVIFLSLNTVYTLTNSGYVTKLISIILLLGIYMSIISGGVLILFYLMLLLSVSLVFDYLYPYYIDLIKESLKK